MPPCWEPLGDSRGAELKPINGVDLLRIRAYLDPEAPNPNRLYAIRVFREAARTCHYSTLDEAQRAAEAEARLLLKAALQNLDEAAKNRALCGAFDRELSGIPDRQPPVRKVFRIL